MSIFGMIITIYVLITLQLTYLSNGDQIPQYVHYDCPRSDFKYASGSTFEANLTNTLVNILPANASRTGFSELTLGEEGADQVNALAYCRADIKGRDCRGCVEAAARTVVQRCRFLKEGIVWYEECTLRYANQSAMFSVDNLEVTPSHRHYNFSGTFRYLEQNEMIFDTLMNRLVQEASYGGNRSGFATGESNLSTSNSMVRGLVQCRPDIGGSHCETCLTQALRQRDGWNTPMVFLPSCSIRFDLYPYAHISPPSPGSDGISLKIIVPVVVVSLVCVLVLCFVIVLVIRRRCHLRRHPPQYEQDHHHPRKFSYLELVWATACFSKRRILGKGGFGFVYKGTLLDGTQVAVKRLNVRGALQGEAEFVAEVAAITHLKHDNVVSLKGYCTFLRQRLLVYKYVDNKTLEHHLHGNGKDLSWEKRMRVALSLAEVFAFLHEKNPAIIHRDIKPSNILLDGEFRPKVGDFGVAKLCPDTRTHVTTIIRGSPGYVDPYYYTSEHLTRKSDVFAFGVVLLELITGRKAIFTVEEFGESEHIIYWAEPLIKEAISAGNFDGLVDQNMGTTYDRDEMDRMVTCAATCVRIKPEERPTMRQVADVLKDSNESSREFKERLMGFWLSEAHRRFYGEGGLSLSISPRTLVGQIDNGCSDNEIPSTNYDSLHNQESQEIYYTATSPIHHSA